MFVLCYDVMYDGLVHERAWILLKLAHKSVTKSVARIWGHDLAE